MFSQNDRWVFRKGIFLLLLMLQFYMLKRYTEPYPSINFPHFQHNFPLDEPIVVSRTKIIGTDIHGGQHVIPPHTPFPYASNYLLWFSWYRIVFSPESKVDTKIAWREYFARPMLDFVTERFSKIHLENRVIVYKDIYTLMADSVAAQLTIYER